MIEFGSDFHKLDGFSSGRGVLTAFCEGRFFACGRQAIDSLIQKERWKRIWMPAYFCYEITEHIAKTGIQIKLYDDSPDIDQESGILRNISFESGDVLLRMNYFGLRGFRSNKAIPVPVIEDHSHGLSSEWACVSDADYCIASLRKSLPLATGGILWSPKRHALLNQLHSSEACEEMAADRYKAMRLKADYLRGKPIQKDVFRKLFVATENRFEQIGLSGMDGKSYNTLTEFDFSSWTKQRVENWKLAVSSLDERFSILKPGDPEGEPPFSLIFIFSSVAERDKFRNYLIANNIYPAILWHIPDGIDFPDARCFSERMLSVHCDGRYSRENMVEMCNIINKYV